MRKFLSGLLCVFAAVAAEAATISITPSNVGEHRMLQDGNTYVFAEDVEFAAEECTSALAVADGATVVLDIPAGVTVTLRGGNAHGKVGAGAGIEVPLNAELFVTGAGKLIAVGGNGANGSDGGAATEGWVNTRLDRVGVDYNRREAPNEPLYFNNGDGGRGGDGGGGAGAGIGGRGGAGGDGGAGASSQTRDWNDSFSSPGSPGFAGMGGGNGGVSGHVEIVDTITKDVRSGVAGTSGGAGGAGVGMSFAWYSNNFGAWSGGGGGGGGAGGAAIVTGIGTGGPGGGGGGGGGSGAFDWYGYVDRFLSHDQYGAGGLGGCGMTGSTNGHGGTGTNAFGETIAIHGTTGKTGSGSSTLTNWQQPGGPGAGGAVGMAPLPEGYAFVNYIESTMNGDQYINTEYVHKSNTRIECSVTVTSHQAYDFPAIFGSFMGGFQTSAFAFFARFDPPKFGTFIPALCRTGHEQPGNPASFPYDTRVDLTCAGRVASWHRFGESAVCGAITNTMATVDGGGCAMSIFVINNNGSQAGNSWCMMKLHSFAIYEGEELKRDFVPCVEMSSGKAGLYDTVSRKFHPNAGQGADFKTVGLVRESYWDPIAKSEKTAWCEVVTSHTDVFEDGKWYAVTDSVECPHIDVNGSANLILRDGVTLRVGSRYHTRPLAAIKVAEGDSLVIYGQTGGTGALFANGCRHGAGIGGGYKQGGGTITINGGAVTAQGGDSGAGIGGGWGGAGGTITINGGTVSAQGGDQGADIGGGADGAGGTVTINGGSVRANRIDGQPVNAGKKPLWRATVPTADLGNPADGLKIEGLPAYYNTTGIHSIENAIHLWLPSLEDGYFFSVSNGQLTHYYCVVVTGGSVTVIPLSTDFRVNGKDIADGHGEGWDYDIRTGLLTLGKQMNYILEGCASNDFVKVVVAANATITLSNALIRTSSAPPIAVDDSFTLKLSAVGASASCLLADNQPAIKGGTTFVEGGSLCLWSDSEEPVSGMFSVAQGEIMCLGENADTFRYVGEYEPKSTDRILIVGPRCRLGVPSVDHANVSVWSQTQELQGKSAGDGVWEYDLMLGDTANVRVNPNVGYVLRGPAGKQHFAIDGDRTLAPSELPVALRALKTDYRAVTVDELGVEYRVESVEAVLFDEILGHLDHIGTVGEDWWVVTGRVDCGSIPIIDMTLNLILGPDANLTLVGDDGEPGIGVMSNACLNIYGCEDGVGTLVAFGGTYAAGIGGGGSWVMDGVPEADAGWITVNGGQVTAVGGSFGAGIGGGAFGAGACLEVNGGSVLAYGGYDAEDIGGGSYGEDGVTVVNGGNVTANSVEAKPVNAAGTRLYRVYAVSENFIPTNDVPLAVKGLGGFGTADVFANEDGAICFYLPNGHYEFTVDGWKCVADVQDGTASAEVGERVKEESEGEGEGEEGTYAEVLGIEVGETVKVTVRSKRDFAYYLVRVTFEDGKLVEDSTAGYGYAEDDTLTLEDENPPAGSGFYVVEEFEL